MIPIEHQATVTKVSAGELTVCVPRQAACGACPAAGLCGMKQNKEQIFSVAVADSSAYNSGDSVIVTLNPRLGWISVLFCYALPLFLMLLTLFSGRYFGQNEIFSGITAIIVLIPYYFLLFLGRNYFKKKFTFKITRQ